MNGENEFEYKKLNRDETHGIKKTAKQAKKGLFLFSFIALVILALKDKIKSFLGSFNQNKE